THRDEVFPLAAVQAAVCEVPYFFRVPTHEHLRHQTLIVRRLISRMGMLKRLPVIGKDLLEDAPVQRRGCTHRLALSWGDTLVTVQRLYHALPASSTPHQSVPGHPSPVSFILELWGLLRPGKCIFLYDQARGSLEHREPRVNHI